MSTAPPTEPIPLLPEDDGEEAIDVVEIASEEEPDTALHWSILLAAMGVLLLAAILQVRGPETVVIPVVDIPLPGSCTYKKFVGMDCPGCGLTRCFISLAHGRPLAAWFFNPAGILFFAIVAGQLPFRGIQIWRIRRGMTELRLRRLGNFLLGFLVVALFSQWIVRSFFL